MRTTRLNERISFVSIKPKKNEDGEVSGSSRTVELKTRCEISTTSRSEIAGSQQNGNIDQLKDKHVLILRYQQRKEIDNNWLVNMRGSDYNIDLITPNYNKKDMIKIAVSKVVK